MQNVDRDIIVIGAGGCGLIAELVAAKKGTRVLLLEKTDKPGGGTAFSSEGIRAAGSRRQHELKIDDSGCNEHAGCGDKDPFGRVLPQPLAPPYYDIKVTVALYHTQGGLKVNADGQVQRADGSIIPNFYAGGGVAVGVSGKGLEGYLPGNGLLASLGFGMIAGEHAVRSLQAN